MNKTQELRSVSDGSEENTTLTSLQTFRPVCVTCGLSVGDKEEAYRNLLQRGIHPGDAMNRLGISNVCCRRHVLSVVVRSAGQFLSDPSINSKLENTNTIINHKMPSTMALLSVSEESPWVLSSMLLKRPEIALGTNIDIDNTDKAMDPFEVSSLLNSTVTINPGLNLGKDFECAVSFAIEEEGAKNSLEKVFKLEEKTVTDF